MRRVTAASLAFSLVAVTIVVGSSFAGDADYSSKSAEVDAAPDVPQSVIDAHEADIASARGLESSRVVSDDDSGPVPIPVSGAVPQPVEGELFEPTLPDPVVPETEPDLVVSPPAVDRETAEFDPATAVELRDQRDAFSKTYQNADGTIGVWLSSIPVHFEDGIGGWKDIDNRIVSDGKGGLTNSANSWRVTFGVMEPGQGVAISTSDGDLRFVADNSQPIAPTVEPDGVSVRYVDVFPDTDLVYIVTGTGIEELLVIKSAKGTAAVTFSFEGLQFDASQRGLTGRGEGIGERVTISAPETFDAQGRSVAVDDQVFTSSDDASGGSKVSVGVTDEYLRSLSADSFPVTVDPSVPVTVGASWLHSYGNWLSTGAWYDSFVDGYARVGNPLISSGTGVRWRTTGFFNYHPYIGASVVGASLSTTMVGGGSTSRSLDVYWAHQDSFNYGINPRWHTQSTPPSSAYTLTTTNSYVTSTLGAVGTTASHSGAWFPTLYNNWTRTSSLNGTLLFRGNESSGINSFKKFSVSLYLVYNRWPSAPTATVHRVGQTFNFTSASATDPDGDSLTYRYRVFQDANGNAVYDTGEIYVENTSGWTSLTYGSVKVDPTWADLPNVRAAVLAYDQMAPAGEGHKTIFSPPVLSYTNDEPPAPALLSPTLWQPVQTVTPTLTVGTVTDPDGDNVLYQFWVCEDYTIPEDPPPTTCRLSTASPSTSWTVPTNFLKYNQMYNWGAIATDGTGYNTPNFGAFVVSYTALQVSSIGTGNKDYLNGTAGVDPANGNYHLRRTDIAVPGVGVDLTLTRSLDTLLVTGADARNGAFGSGWTTALDMNVRTDSGHAYVRMPDGKEQFFGLNWDGSYSTTLESGNTLTKTAAPNEWHLTDTSNTVYDFSGTTGKLLRVTDDAGRVMQSNWSAGETVQEFKDVASGRSLTLTYTTPAGATFPHVSEVATASVAAHGGALVWKYYYTGDLLTKVCDPRDNSPTGKCEVYGYDEFDRLVTIAAVAGNVHTTLTYDGSNRVLTNKNAYNDTWTLSYSTADTTVTPPSGTPFSVRRTTMTDPRGKVTLYDFNNFLRLVHTVDPYSKQRWLTYDENGFLAQTINELGEIEQYTSDDKGHVTRRTDAANQYWDSAFNAQGLMTATEDPLNHGPTFTYSAAGLKLTETSELGRTTTWTYTTGAEAAYGSAGTMPAGLVRTVTDPLTHVVVTNDYNAAGDLTRTTDAAGKQTINTYDEIGRLATSSIVWVNGAGVTVTTTTTITYDVMSRPLTITAPEVVNPVTSVSHQLQTTNVYDDNGNLTQSTQSDTFANDTSRITQYAYDLADRQWRITDAEAGVTTRQFDARGNVTHVIDPLGRDLQTTYDDMNRPIDVILHDYVDPAAPASPRDITMSHTSYDDLGRPKAVTDAIGTVTEYSYETRGNQTSAVLKSFVPVSGSAYDFVLWQKSFDYANRVTWEESGNGVQRVEHTYDDDNRPTVDTVKNGPVSGFTLPDKTITTTYDAASNVIEVVVADGVHNTESRRILYDTANRPTQTTVENGATDLIAYTTYDQLGNPVRQVDARGSGPTDTAYMTTNFYDTVGVLFKTELPSVSIETVAGVTTAHPSVISGRNTFGETTYTVDANGATSSSTYDRLGRQTIVTAASYTQPGASPATLQPTETRVFDAVGNLRYNTDRRGHTTEYQYDSLNRATKQIDPLASGGASAGVSTVAYGDTGLTMAATTAQGVVTDFTYDKLGRTRTVVEHVTDNGSLQTLTTTNDYDGAGKLISTTDPAGATTTAVYSRTGQLERSTDPLGYITSYEYDTAGRTIKTVGPSGVYQTTTYDLAGRAIATATFTAAGVSTLSGAATYDKVNNMLTNTDTAGTVTTYTYDASNSLLSITQPISVGLNSVTSYGYDANGNNTRVTDGNNNAWYTTYNTWGLVESRVEPATSAYPNAADRTFTTRYDAGGLPILEMQPGVNISRVFDNLGRLTAESTPDGANRGFTYDLANRPTVVTSGATSISLSYNERSQLVSATGSAGASSFRYDQVGRPTQRADAAGTTGYSWRSNGQLYQIGDPVTGQTSTYNWAAPATAHAGQLTTVTTPTTTRTYDYDSIDRVISDITTAGANTRWSATYHYNSAGRVDTKTIGPAGVAGAGTNSYTYSLAGQLTSWTDPASVVTAYAYDLAGNRTSNGTTTIAFDQRNRIVTEGTKAYDWTARGTLDAITAGAVTTNYAFDGLGRMTGADGVGYSYDALNRIINRETTAFTYSGVHNQPTSDGTTVLSRTPNGSPHAIAEGSTTLTLLADRHGDVVASLTAAGTLTDSIAYTPWGEPAARQGATALTVGYQSSYTDPTTGLIDMGARWYRASTGTFTNRDSYNGVLSTPISLNRYTYANNNPIEFFDPDGRKAACAEGSKGCGVDFNGNGKLARTVSAGWSGPKAGSGGPGTNQHSGTQSSLGPQAGSGGPGTNAPKIFATVDPPAPLGRVGNALAGPISHTIEPGFWGKVGQVATKVVAAAVYVVVLTTCATAAGLTSPGTGGATLVAGAAVCTVAAGAAARGADTLLTTQSPVEAVKSAGNPRAVIFDGAAGLVTGGMLAWNAQIVKSGTQAMSRAFAGEPPNSPRIDPADLAGKTPAEIDALARQKGLIPKGPDPMSGKGSYVDPVTGQQRVLCHPGACPPHAHVNNPAGQRLDINGNVVPPGSPAAHLPLRGPR